MSDLVGKNIANYQVVELIDGGGRSQVYRGFQASTNRYVAIKVLKEELTQDPAVTQSFDQYAQRAAAMQNPHILPMLDAGQENGIHYLVTPFFENKSVASHLSFYADPHQALNLVQAIIAGLEFIYSQGTVHANLKPTNIMLNDQRQPLLADFGMASQVYGPMTAYTSPEQTQGGVVDQRTDVYALGVLLYELLTGGTPPAGTTVNLRSLRPDVPQSVEQVILKAMAPNPEQRFQTPRQFGSALSNALQPAAPQPVAAPVPAPTTAPPPAQQKSGTNWMGIFLGGIVVILMCLCAIVVVPKVIDALGEQSDEVAAEPTAEVLPEPTEIPIEEIEPTREPAELPTREPDEQPPEQAPPSEEDPSAGQLPAASDGGSQICGSLGFAGGFILLGGVFSFRRKKKF